MSINFKGIPALVKLRNKGKFPVINPTETVLIREKGEDSYIEISGVTAEINSKITIKIGNRSRVKIEGIQTLNTSLMITLGDDCELLIKDGQRINGPLRINQLEASKVTIGKNGLFGPCRIWTSDFHSLIDNHTKIRINPPKDVVLGDHVWLGAEALILKGSIIGDDSVVAARSVVTKSYPSNSLIGGNPSRLLKSNISWDNKLLPYNLEN